MGVREIFSEISDNHPLYKAKAFYLLFDAAIKALPRHLGMYYKHTLLLSPHQVAMLLSIRPFILIFGSPFLGSIADKTNRFRPVILISLLTFLVTYILVPLVEPVEGFNCQENIHFNHSIRHLNFSNFNLSKPNPLIHKKVEPNRNVMRSRVHNYYEMIEVNETTKLYSGNLMRDLFYTWPFDIYEYATTDDITAKVFTVILIITIIGEFFASPAETFADLYTLRVLDTNRRLFGLQILPGLFGFFIVSISFAAVSNIQLKLKDDFCHVGHIINYSSFLLVIYALIVMCIVIAATFQYKVYPTKYQRKNCVSGSCNFLMALPVLVETPAYAAYAVAVICCGFGCGVKQLYIYHYLAELGGPHQLIFVVLTVHFISGLIALLLSPKLLDRFGESNIIAAGLLSNGVSFVVYSLIKNPWMILIVEPIHGLSQELTWVAIVTYAGAPPHIGAALQGTVHGLHKGLGIAFGYYAVCVLILKYGYVPFFLGTGLFFFALFGFYLFVIRMYPKEESIAENYNAYSRLAHDDEDSQDEGNSTEMQPQSKYDQDTLDKSFLE